MTAFEIISLIATAGLFAGLYRIGKVIGGLEESIKNIKTVLNNLPCEHHRVQLESIQENVAIIKSEMVAFRSDLDVVKNDMVEVKKDMVEVKKDMVEVKKDIVVLKSEMVEVKNDIFGIKTFLTTKYKNTEIIWGRKHSPTVLNENGQRLMAEIKGARFLENNQDFFVQKLSEKCPKTPLDVEVYANEVLLALTDNKIFNDIKNWIYNSTALIIKEGDSTREYIISLCDVCYVLSIALRDIYLSLHTELNKKSDQL